jgi:hypothetical protein
MAESPRDNPTRQDTWQIRMHLSDPQVWLGVWDKKTGGEIDSDETKYNPGAMRDPISLGGKKTVGNITLQRIYDRVDDHDNIMRLINGVGKRKCRVSVHPMTFFGHNWGKALLYDGVLKRVSLPDVDSESNSAALIEVEITIDGIPKMN